MKKIIGVLVVICFILVGCGNAVDNEKKDAINLMSDYGLTKEASENYYNYVDSLKNGFSELIKVDDKLEENSFKVANADRKKTLEYFDSAYTASSEFDESLANDLYDFIHEMHGPSYGLDIVEEEKRNFGFFESGIMVKTFNSATKSLLDSVDISSESKEKLYEYYDSTVYSGDNIFREINDEVKAK